MRQDSLLSFAPGFSKKNKEAMALGLKYLHRIIEKFMKNRHLTFKSRLNSGPSKGISCFEPGFAPLQLVRQILQLELD